jgi:hypothetical protein
MANTEQCCVQPSKRRALLRNWNVEKRIEKGYKEPPEKMLRSLQGVFCTGRYQSWVAVQKIIESMDRKEKEKEKKKRRTNKAS